ncbi:pseudaminic acid cytidylyltransferase [Gammaproteobacteria bacterium]|nr:pseudaminic acid cytidylyltransferase [Gammaproteobacteria bacterium]
MIIAVIPARGGSKRIPNKNIREFHDKPIIGWSIEAAIEAGCFDRVIVSTDSEQISEIAKKFGAEVPFIRNQDLADDYTPTLSVISDSIQKLDCDVDYACCIYPTAPFVTPKDLNKGLKIIESKKVNYVFAATRYNYPIQRALKIQKNGLVSMLDPELENHRSQDLELMYHDAGQFYWGKSDAWLNQRPIFQNSCILEVPEERSQDIDNEDDWNNAEIKFKFLKKEGKLK